MFSIFLNRLTDFLSCEVEKEPAPSKQESIGIDLGLTHFAVFSNGQKIANPKFFKEGKKNWQRLKKVLPN